MKKHLLVMLLLFSLCATLTVCHNPFTLDFSWRKAEITVFDSEPISVTRPENEQTVLQTQKISARFYGGQGVLGSLQSSEYVIYFADQAAKTYEIGQTFYINPMLDKLRITGRPGQVLSAFSFHVLERTTSLTIVVTDVQLSANAAQLISYDGESEFETNVIVKGSCSFANGTAGSSAAAYSGKNKIYTGTLSAE